MYGSKLKPFDNIFSQYESAKFILTKGTLDMKPSFNTPFPDRGVIQGRTVTSDIFHINFEVWRAIHNSLEDM